MPTDNYTLIGLAFAGLLVAWLVFSLFRKLFGLALIAALALGIYLFFTNPALLEQAADAIGRQFGQR